MASSISISSASASAPKKTKKVSTASKEPKEPKEPKVSAKVAAPVEEPIVEAVEAVEATEETVVLESSFDELMGMVEAQEAVILAATKELFRLNKLLKSAYKKDNKLYKLLKSQKTKAVRKPAEKHVIVDSLAKLMNVPKKSTFDRNEIHRFICDYIRQHELQYEDDRTTFNPDTKLAAVLGEPIYETKKGSGIYRHSYNNLFKVLGSLFIK